MVSVVGFAGVELWVGQVSHSLTLRADSGHMLTDGLAVGVALTAAWMAQRSQSATMSRSNHRLELWAALVNGLSLLVMAAWIGQEAMAHWHKAPTEILSYPMLVTALLGLVVNGLNLYWLHGGIHGDLNLRGVFLHVVADLIGSVGAILAALAVTFLQWAWADTLIGVLVAFVIAISAVPLLWQSLLHLGKQQDIPPQASLESLGWLETGKTELTSLLKREPSS